MRHPLHPALVHFPIACWTLAVISDFSGLYFGAMAWSWSGGLLAVGCIMAVIAMLAGLLEFTHVPEGPAMRDVYLHMGFMFVSFMLFATRLFLRLDHLQPLEPNTLSLLIDLAGLITLMVGGWFGGRLVYGHGVGRK
ncbi:MAG: DUF2231 domain-containing protein [Candidatus Nucleicultricaceae bacterium]